MSRAPHPTANHPQARGTIVCRLDEVMLRAQQRWHIRVTASKIARATKVHARGTGKLVGLNVKTILRLARDESTLYDQHTLANLCWYFGCQVGDLLEYVPPGLERTPVPVEHIKRDAAPDSPPPEELTLVSHIAEVISAQGKKPATVARLAHVKWDTVTGHTQEAHRSRIGQQTLVHLCEVLDVGVGTLLTFEEGSHSLAD